VDVGCALIKGDDGLLTLDVYKTRATSEFKLTIQPDYERGQFELVDSPASVGHREDAVTILREIEQNPGISQIQLLRKLNIRHQRAIDLLRAHAGELWTIGGGSHGAKNYYPVSTYARMGTGDGNKEQVAVPVPTLKVGNREQVAVSVGGSR
jgi:hypothetical protein